MKNTVLILFFFAASHQIFAQDFGFSLSLGARKTFKLSKKTTLDLRQQIQLNPEIKKYNNKYGDFFNEEGFWPIPDRYEEDDELDDDDLPPGAGSGIPNTGSELDDTPRDISLDWRSTTAFQYNYQFFSWLRTNGGYSLLFDGEELRHNFRAELDYRPLRHCKKKQKIDLSARGLFQYVGQSDDGVYEWDALLIPRLDAEWTFKKNHILGLSNALNGGWKKGALSFDRWRITPKFVFIYEKKHRFTFSYQYQQRIGKPKHSQGMSFGYEVRF